MKVRFKKLVDTAVTPTYAKDGDAGLDLTSIQHTISTDYNYIQHHTGIAIEIPKGYVGSQFITNDNYYFIRSSVRGLVVQEREKARIMEDLLQRSMQREVVSYMRFGVGCYDFRSIYGNPGS